MRKLKCCILMTSMILLFVAAVSAFLFVKAALWWSLFYHMHETNGWFFRRFGSNWNEERDGWPFFSMPAHKFTKKEKRVFYLNLIVAIIGFVLSLNISIMVGAFGFGMMYRSHRMHWLLPVCTLRSLLEMSFLVRVGSSIMGTAFIGMFALLLSAQFAHCWTIVVINPFLSSYSVYDCPGYPHFEYCGSGDYDGCL